jgi:hypothetical protein
VSDLDDAAHGEINILDNPDEASRFVESLIESGFDQDRIRVFNGDEMSMQIHHRPVVSLLPEEQRASKESQPLTASHQRETVEQAERVAARVTPVSIEVASAEPLVKNGVKFSTLFRPA